MLRLPQSLNAWQTPAFKETLKAEIEHLDAQQLPLQQGLSQSSYVSDEGFRVMVISVAEHAGLIRAKAGIFYTGAIPGCNCADDPTPIDTYPEYCEVQFDIDKTSAAITLSLLTD